MKLGMKVEPVNLTSAAELAGSGDARWLGAAGKEMAALDQGSQRVRAGGRSVAGEAAWQADLQDIVAATRQTYREMLEGTAALYQKRAAFMDFWVLVREAHPVQGCRLGAQVRAPRAPVCYLHVPV